MVLRLRAGSHTALFAAVIFAGAALRFLTIDVQSLSHDEGVTAMTVLQPGLGDTLSIIQGSERTPPLFYMLSWGWTKIFGVSTLGLRSFSALAGSLAIPVCYLAGREVGGRRAGLIAAALVAFSPFMIWYSQEARAYGLLMLFAALSLLFFLAALDRKTLRYFVLWALASALALATHYFAVFLVIPQALWLVASARDHRRHALLACSVVAAVGLALLPLAAHQSDSHSGVVSAALKMTLPERVLYLPLGFGSAQRIGAGSAESGLGLYVGIAGAIALSGIVLASLTALALTVNERLRRRAAALLTICLAALVLPLGVALIAQDYFNARNVGAAIVPVTLLIGLGLAVVQHRTAIIATTLVCAIFLAATAVIQLTPDLHRGSWRTIAQRVPADRSTQLLIMDRRPWMPVFYYLQSRGVRRLLPSYQWRRSFGPHLSQTVARDEVPVGEIVRIDQRDDHRPKLTPPGFHLTHTRLAHSYVINIFESSRPRLLRLPELLDSGVIRPQDRFLIDNLPQDQPNPPVERDRSTTNPAR